MLFKRIYDEDLAQASYFIGCQSSGIAAVVDPRRDIAPYLDEAERNGMRIVAVTETHIHADYLSGSRELAAATGADLYVSGEGGADWQYAFDAHRLEHGGEIRLGNITLRAVHTPGHTPEHLSFLVTDGALSDEPGYVLTGDFVFVGDVGRPDLLDEAAGGQDTRYEGAKSLFASLRDEFLTLPDYVQVWPGHGSGSACGKALGAVASTTVGYERRVAWWAPFVEGDDLEGFTEALLEGQPDAPSYFGRMKRENRDGPPILGALEPVEEAGAPEAFLGGQAQLVDVRPHRLYEERAVPGAIHVPAGDAFAGWAAWVLEPSDGRDIVLLGTDREGAERLRRKLIGIGIDNRVRYRKDAAGLAEGPAPSVSPAGLEKLEAPFILDVRTQTEHAEGHIPGAAQIHGGRVLAHQDELPTEGPLVVHCQSGARSAVVASALRAAGFREVLELEGGFAAWQEAQQPVS